MKEDFREDHEKGVTIVSWVVGFFFGSVGLFILLWGLGIFLWVLDFSIIAISHTA